MTLQRKSAQSDVEVEMNFTKMGEVYSVTVGDKPVQNGLTSPEAYELLVEAFNDSNVRLPSRFVVEFGQHVINSLLQKIR